MINAINIGLGRIHQRIPKEILELAFSSDTLDGYMSRLRKEVFDDFIIVDCNIGGGKTVQIELKRSWEEETTDGKIAFYRIPPEARDNRDIIEVHRIQHNIYGGIAAAGVEGDLVGYVGIPTSVYDHGSAIQFSMSDMLESKTGIGGFPYKPNVPIVEVVSGDLIRLSPPNYRTIDWLLICRLAFDREMTNLNSDAIDVFGNLAVLACQMKCYTNLIVKMDTGMKEFGSDVPAIRDLVSNWGDLNDTYHEMKNKFLRACSLDIQRISAIIKYAL